MDKSKNIHDEDIIKKIEELNDKSAELSQETKELIEKMKRKNGEARDAMIELKKILFL